MPLENLNQLLATGAYLQARREAERLLAGGNLSRNEEPEVYRVAARACLELNDFFAAVRFGERAVERAMATTDRPMAAAAHFDLSCAYVAIGDGHPAQEHAEAFLCLAGEVPHSEEQVGQAYHNLAAVFRQRRDWQAAVDALHRADAAYGAPGKVALRARCALDLARCYLAQAQPDPAGTWLSAAQERLSDDPDSPLSCDLLCARALWHRQRGDLAGASALCQEVFLPGRRHTESRHLAEAAWIMGENALDLNMRHEASFFAGLAMEHGVKSGLPTLMNLANDLRRRATLGDIRPK